MGLLSATLLSTTAIPASVFASSGTVGGYSYSFNATAKKTKATFNSKCAVAASMQRACKVKTKKTTSYSSKQYDDETSGLSFSYTPASDDTVKYITTQYGSDGNSLTYICKKQKYAYWTEKVSCS